MGSGRSATVTRLSLVDLKTVWVAPFPSAFNMVGLAFGPGEKEIITCQAYDRHHSIAKHNIEQGWAIDNRLGRLKLDGRIETTSGAPELAEQEQLSVDMRGQASGDLGAVFVSVDGKWMAVCGSGTQELFVLPGTCLERGRPRGFHRCKSRVPRAEISKDRPGWTTRRGGHSANLERLRGNRRQPTAGLRPSD